MQALKPLKPLFVNTDLDELSMPAQAGKFIKGIRIGGGKNANLSTGTGSDTPAGNNQLVQASVPGNTQAIAPALPEGINKSIGGAEFQEVNKTFYLNYNSKGNHGIYMLDGETLAIDTVSIDPLWNFSLDPQYEVPAHRMSLWVLYGAGEGSSKKILEMYLIFTDGLNWQRWINVLAAVRTNGYNVEQFPYFAVTGPHYDRASLFDYATRPPMRCPQWTEVVVTDADKSVKNQFLNKSTQIAYKFMYRDGRTTTLSPFSLPFVQKEKSCNLNSSMMTRCLDITLDAGSPQVEKVLIYRRFCSNDWTLYDTISKYSSCDGNDPAVIGDAFWLRTNPWDSRNYDPLTNTFVYRFCNDKECALVDQEDIRRFQTDLPINSIAQTTAGDSILFSNNKYFYNPLSCDTLKNLKINVKLGITQLPCDLKNVKISVYSFMSRNTESVCFAYIKGDDKTVRFGGASLNVFSRSITIDEEESKLFGLTFNGRDGFVCYLRGTPYMAVGKQYRVYSNGTKEFLGVIDIAVDSQKELVTDILTGGGTIMMQYDFTVPAGKYIATLAAHDADLGDDYQKTSTYLHGIGKSIARDTGALSTGNMGESILVSRDKEIEINACAGDVDLWRNPAGDFFYVYVPKDYESGENRRWRFVTGYVKEEKDSKIGVELLLYEPTNGEDAYKKSGLYTDHNGFFYIWTARGAAQESDVSFRGKFNCINDGNELFRTSGLPSRSTGYYKTDVIVSDKNGGNFGKCNRILVRGRITTCDGGAGIGGIAVTLTRGMTTYTDTEGNYELVAHNSYLGNRQDRIYMNASGACVFVGCDCECTHVVSYDDTAIACFNCVERLYPLVNRSMRVVVTDQKALKGGARYGVVVFAHDLAGRSTLANFIQYITIPTFMERGNYAPNILEWEQLGLLNLPPEFKYLTFGITRNLDFETPLQWVGDKIEFLDNQGDITGSAAGAVKARITIQSLNDFNVENNFATTTKYQFVAGDILRIMDDGDGKLFDPAVTNGFMDYPILGTNYAASDEATPDGKSFIIPFDSRLVALKDKCGFWIEIQRPKECLTKEVYCEICGTYDLVNGEISGGIKSGVLNAWDTYYQSRFFQITGCSGKSFLHPFESSSISDFFGENCGSCGRQSFRDETVVQRWYPDDIIKSDDFVNEGGYNGLGTLREKNRKHFKGQQGGGIVAMHAERKIIFCVAQNDWFTLDYNLNVVRVSEGGIAIATLDQSLSDQNQKAGMNYGSAFDNTGTIHFFDGLALWCAMGNRAWIMSDYRTASKISAIDNEQYFFEKLRYIDSYNKSLSPESYLSNLIEVNAGIDIMGRELHVTFRPRKGMLPTYTSFVNELREIIIPHQETFTFHIDQKKWMRFNGFTPEAYLTSEKLKNGGRFIAFAQGNPFYHEVIAGNNFNTFFGIQTEEVTELVYAEDKNKVKIFESTVIESNNKLWFIDRAYTEEMNSFSYVPPPYMKQKENTWYAEFLADMNSYPDPAEGWRKMLTDGKRVHGKFLRARYVSDPTKLGQYAELSEIFIRTAGSERSAK
jgi:hypothetical protein